MNNFKYFWTVILFLCLGVEACCQLAFCESETKLDAKTIYKNLKPFVETAFKEASSLPEEINSLDLSSKSSLQDAVNLVRGAALEATLLLNMAYKEIQSGNENNALASLEQISQQLERVTSYAKNVRDQITPKLARIKSFSSPSHSIPKSKNANNSTKINLAPDIQP